MFPTFIGILDIQSWWEVPSIAHFCSLFRAAFNLLDFDIEDLEEALLTDGGTEGRLVQELIVRLLEGCLPNDTRNDISTFNYQMFLRRLFRKKCQEYKSENPFNTDVDFELLPLRQKVEILRALCDFRLDAEDVEQSLSNLDSDSLRVEPLGHDRKNSAYWYFYGTRLYREDYIDCSSDTTHKQKSKPREKKRKRRRNRVAKEEEKEEEKEEDSFTNSENRDRESIWQVVCFTQQDWSRLVEKFRDSEYATERKLYRTLAENFMPEIPKLFDLKEKQQRRKLLQRNNSRVLRSQELSTPMETAMVKSKVKTKNNKANKKGNQSVKAAFVKEDTPPRVPTPPLPKKGRQTNNSLASAVGQIVIHTQDEVGSLEKKKGVVGPGDKNYVSSNYGYKYGYSFGIEEEERRVGMHKVLESLKDHVDAWPFVDPVDEEYAPRYYSVVRKPMDLSTMEEKLEGGSYKSVSQFKRDFRLIVDNCKQYNGSDNEYTEMAFNLKDVFEKAVTRYLESETSSDEEPTSPPSVPDAPSVTACPSQSVSPLQNTRKRSKKSSKKSKTYKSDSKDKPKPSKVEEEEKVAKPIKVASKKKAKKKGKVVKAGDSLDEEEEEEAESEDAISDIGLVTGKTRKTAVVNSVLLKAKKLSPKELDKVNKKPTKERHQRKKDIENVKPTKEPKESKKRKEHFEEDYEPIAKSKSRKIETKELEEPEIPIESAKKSKVKKVNLQEEEEPSGKEEQSHHIKQKKSRKKEKAAVKTAKSEEKPDKNRTKHKDKKSKVKEDELKNGDLSKEEDSPEENTQPELHSSTTEVSKKMVAFTGDKDLESLDSLKDKISEKRREEKLKHEKEKQKKTAKGDLQAAYSKKVPSNGSTFHDGDKVTTKKQKLKKGAKEEKVTVSEEAVKASGQVLSGAKKAKAPQTKHSKTFRKEESSAIQALNQATEQTLHDINKWLDDAPRLSEFSSGSDSPILHPPTDVARAGPKADAPRKRPSSMKIFGPHGPTRPKKIQRTIDRLQPGKSKGNLLLKKPLNLPSTTSETTGNQYNSDNDQGNKDTDDEPKLSLGTVLKNADSIQLICKSLVASPNPTGSNEDEEDDPIATSTRQSPHVPEAASSTKATSEVCATAEESKDSCVVAEEAQKPKTATPNLSAWFKAFGAPKSKKKDEEPEEPVLKKDGELQEVCGGRQRRMSTGGSSVSESVSSFSQESPPGRSGRSPQGQPVVLPSEPAIRGAGFYQDALSTGNSPYSSPYYATPPRYSAQLPPTPSPQNHPLSPAYPSPASYEPPPIYPQTQQPSHQGFQKHSPQDGSNEVYHQMSPTFSQRSPQSNFPPNPVAAEPYNQQASTTNQNQSPVYIQHSPQPVQPVYPQTSPQAPASNYSQPSPQQPPQQTYPQLSPQPNPATKYSQPSPQPAPSYSQPSPQQQHSPYSQPSPQQQHSPYASSSPQQSSPYSQLSPQPPLNYSQPSPQPPPTFPQRSPQPPPVYTQQSPQPSNFSQPSPQAPPAGYAPTSPQPLTYSQPSPQPRNYSQPSPQQIQTFAQHSPQPPPTYSQQSPQNSNFSQPSPQQLTNYSQPSPQQAASYSHPLQSPQTPPNYPQLSPRQMPAANYSQQSASPQQSHTYSQLSPQHKAARPTQPSPQPPTYPQPSPQPIASYTQPTPPKSAEESTPNSPTPTYPHGFKQNQAYIQSSAPVSSTEAERVEYIKASNNEKSASAEQQRTFAVSSDAPLTLNAPHQIYQSPSQYSPAYANNFTNIDLQRTISKHTSQEQQQSQQSPQDRPNFSNISEPTNTQKYAQQRSFLGKAPGAAEHLQTQEQSQVLPFQQNLAHESLYQAGFQPSGYAVANSRPMYPNPHYFDATTKVAPAGAPNASNSLPPVKKRVYNESIEPARSMSQDSSTRIVQEQFAFDPMMALPQSDTVSASQFDNSFVGSLADPATNPAYARLGLGLVSRSSKEQQQLLTIPRPPGSKPEHLAYARNPGAGTAELDLNLLQSLQSAASKNPQGTLSMPRRANESTTSAAPTSTKTKKRRSKQQLQTQQTTVAPPIVSTDQQPTSLPSFPQYTGTSADSLGLKNAPVVPPPAGSAFNFAAPGSTTPSSPFYDKDPTAAAAAFAFLDEFRNRNSYYSMALRQQQQQQQQQQQITPVSDAGQSSCNKLNNPPPRNYPPHSFLHSTQRSAAYGPPVPAYVAPHAPNLTVDPAAYQQYFHSFYALQHHRPSWL